MRCCRIVVQDNVVIPSFSEAIVPGKVVFEADQMAQRSEQMRGGFDLMVEPQEVRDGLCVAGTILPSRCHNVPVRVVNTSCRDVSLVEEETLGELQELQLGNVITCPAVDPGMEVTGD